MKITGSARGWAIAAALGCSALFLMSTAPFAQRGALPSRETDPGTIAPIPYAVLNYVNQTNALTSYYAPSNSTTLPTYGGFMLNTATLAQAPPAIQAWFHANVGTVTSTPSGNTLLNWLGVVQGAGKAADFIGANADLAHLSDQQLMSQQGWDAKQVQSFRQDYTTAAKNIEDAKQYLDTFTAAQVKYEEQPDYGSYSGSYSANGNLSHLMDPGSGGSGSGSAAALAALTAQIKAQLGQLGAGSGPSGGLDNLINSGTSFGSVQLIPIYNGSQLIGYQGPSSAGVSGYNAVPWLSPTGTGVSSGGPALYGSNLSNTDSGAALCGQ